MDKVPVDKCFKHGLSICACNGHIANPSNHICDLGCYSPRYEEKPGDDKILEQMKENFNTLPVFNTTVKTKAEHFQKFSDLIGNQFKHGGDKYSLKGMPDREATDVISSIFGGDSQFDWILGTMMKYLLRFKNFEREKDLLKIATYCYILWLKQGNHLKGSHDEDTKR